jgi:hypothetical protein
MAEQIFTYSLTTVARLKELITLTSAGFDVKLLYLINSVTDFIEGECNRRFKETTYTNEIYSIDHGGQNFLQLKQFPVSAVTSLKYKAGTKSNPNWTEFNADDWEVLEDGETGLIQIYGTLPIGINNISVTYTAGYKINFTNYGDNTTHTLPADLTGLAERLVTKFLKRREAEGKLTESYDGGSVTWKDDMTGEDKATIDRFKRVGMFF